MKTTVDISLRSFMNALAIGLFAWVCWVVRDVLVVVLLAVVLSAALHPAITWMERHGYPRPAGVLSLYVLLLGILTIIFITFTPLVIVQFRQLVEALAHLTIRLAGGQHIAVTNALSTGVTNIVKLVSSNALSTIMTLSNIGFLIFIIGLLIYYLTVDHGNFRRTLAELMPAKYRQVLLEQGNAVEHRLSLWLRGQLVLGLVIAVLSGTGLFIMHIPYALVLGLIAGICELIPMVGPYLGMLPAAAIGFSLSPFLGGAVVLLYYLIQQVENNFLAPKIVSKAVGLKPVVVLLALLVGARVFGVLGLLLAVPCVILLQAAYSFWHDARAVAHVPHAHV